MTLLAEWSRLSASGFNNRAIAKQLAVSEARLVAEGCGSVSTRLTDDAWKLLDAVRSLGKVKWVVRNDDAVLERPGELQILSSSRDTLRAAGETFLLTLSRGEVASAFALEEARAGDRKRSLQLFDAGGTTLVKIVLREESSVDAFEALVRALRHPEQSLTDSVGHETSPAAPSRTHAASLASFLMHAAQTGMPLRFRVRNCGAELEARTRIHHVKRSERAPWINVLDPQLDLHLHEQALTRASLEPPWIHWHGETDTPALSVEACEAFDELVAAAIDLPKVPAQV